ncbi:hypothetical protein HYT84_03940 [Candidatus Micrarchaeota archaeon]|nr:hypothetical protein [Candidatus Micrarchaeota archaeon]
MKEITIVAKNNLGSLAAVTEALGNSGVNIEAISAYEKNDSAIFRIVTNDVTTTRKILGRIPDLRLLESDIIILNLPNKPGELGKITKKLSLKGVNLESLYIIGKESNYTSVGIKPSADDFEKAKEALGLK